MFSIIQEGSAEVSLPELLEGTLKVTIRPGRPRKIPEMTADRTARIMALKVS